MSYLLHQVLIGAVDKKKLAECLVKLVLSWHGQKDWYVTE